MMHKCDRCDSPATCHLTEIVSGKKVVEKHLCQKHAVEEGVVVQPSELPPAELLEKLVLKHVGNSFPGTNLSCPDCGTTFEEFRKGGLLGCPACYKAMERALGPILSRTQEGATHHVGKVPARAGVNELRQNRLRQLRTELEQAVAKEQYERAASLRDQLKATEEA